MLLKVHQSASSFLSLSVSVYLNMAITVLNSVDVKPSPAADPATCPSAPLSPLDRIVPNVNASLLFFLRDRTDKPSLDPTTLKSSLARALAEFPTLAGEIVPKPGQAPTLVASDRGVSFVHARSDTGIDELSQSSWAAAKIPQELFASGPFPQPGQTLLGIQLTEVSISFCLLCGSMMGDFDGRLFSAAQARCCLR